MGEALKDATLIAVAAQQSPIAGHGAFKKLSKSYAAKKRESGADPVPNLEFDGNMLSALDVRSVGNHLEIGVFGSEAPKADGHNDLSGSSRIPTRRFIPDEGEAYKPSIQQEIDEIINEVLAENAGISEDSFSGVETSSELYAVLQEALPGLLRSEVRSAVLSNSKLSRLLMDLDLFDLL